MKIEQAVYGGQDVGGYRFLARSPGFVDEWLPEAERLCTGFGERPSGVACPGCVFARPFGPRHVAVVQAADQGADDTGRPGALGFRLLVLPRRLYADLGADPFWIAERLPPPWGARGELPTLGWEFGAPPRRTVADLQRVLSVPEGPTLLGGVQALLDGARLVFERGGPEPGLLRGLWALLPNSSRAELWPANFAFSNAHGFHAVVVPRASGPQFAYYVRESEAGDYPEGRYELALQTAVESGDQAEVDALFARRSRAQTLRLGFILLALFLIVPVIALSLPTGDPPPDHRPKAGKQAPDGGKAAPEKLRLPPAEEYPALGEGEAQRLAGKLQELGKRLGVAVPAGSSPEALGEALAALDAGVDRKLGAKRPTRDPGELSRAGPPQRRLRALLWKHGGKEYNEPGLNPVELVEKLEGRLAEEGLLKEGPGE